MTRLRTNIIASFVSRSWSALLAILLVPTYIRFLGVEAYGVVGAFITVQALISLLDLGFSATLTRALARSGEQPSSPQEMRDLLRTIELLYWCMALAIVLGVSALAPLAANHWLRLERLSAQTVTHAIAAAAIAFALQWPANLYAAGLAGLQRQVALGWITGVCGTLRGAAAIAAMWLIAPTLSVFFLAQAAVNALQTCALGIALWQSMPAGSVGSRVRPQLVRSSLRFAGGMSGISLTSVVLTQFDKAILSRTLPLSAFGYYAIAGTLASGLYVVISPMFAALFPKFSQLAARGAEGPLESLYGISTQLLASIILPCAAVMALFSPEILQLWTGDLRIAQHSHLLLSLLVVGNLMNGLMNVPYALQLAHGWTMLALYANVVAITVCAPLTYFLSKQLGALGGALVWLMLTLAYLALSLPLMHRRLLRGRLTRWYTVDVGRPALGALSVVLLARLLLPLPSSRLAAAATLLFITGCACTAAALSSPDLRSRVLGRLTAQQAPG